MDNTIYESFASWLSKSWYGIAKSKHLMPLLKAYYTPEEAKLLTGFPFKFTSIEEIAASTKLNVQEIVEKLDDMARKGMVYRSEKDGQVSYRLNDPFFVFYRSAYWPDRQSESAAAAAPHMNKYHLDGFMDRFAHAHHKGLRSIPIDNTVEDGRKILSYEDVIKFVDSQDYCTVSNCACRMKYKLDPDEEVCAHPMEVCLHFGKLGRYIVENDMGREITKEETKAILKNCADSGLVHSISTYQEGQDTICNCCSCHCLFMTAYHQLNHFRGTSPSNFVVRVTPETCKACGLCMKRCPMDALQLKVSTVATNKARKAAVVNPDCCIGCGVCVHKCPSDSLILVRREEDDHPPKTAKDWVSCFFEDRKTGPKYREES